MGGVGGASSPPNFGGTGGKGGVGGAAANAGVASGGAISVAANTLLVTSTTFGGATANLGNQVTGGAGGVGGLGGVGGAGGNGGNAGTGGNGGIGGVGASAYGGAVDVGGSNAGINAANVTLGMTAAPVAFTFNALTSGAGGSGGNGGNAGAGNNPINGAGGAGGNGGVGYGGGFSYFVTNGSPNTAINTVAMSFATFTSNMVTGGNGGNGGALGKGSDGAGGVGSDVGKGGSAQEIRGGGAAIYDMTETTTVSVVSSSFTLNQLMGGTGGEGTLGGGAGGGSSAYGGGLDILGLVEGTATVTDTSATSNMVKAGAGGLGAVAGSFAFNGSGTGGVGGVGGTAGGGGVASDNYDLLFTSSNPTTAPSLVNGNSIQGGVGGHGGFGNGPGGNAGSGGTAAGGGLYFHNTTGAKLSLTFTGNSSSLNTVTGGAGGTGAASGDSVSHDVNAAVGGTGGLAVGGGIYMDAGVATSSAAFDVSIINNDTLDGNTLNGGHGGGGGQGEGFSTLHGDSKTSGGNGGVAAGGGIYNNSVNTTKAGTISLSGDTLAGNRVNGGVGGNAGTGNTGNGGYGGDGGNGGSGFGGGLYNDDNSTLTVYNTTIGGADLNDSLNTNSNILNAGNGGDGGNAGIPPGASFTAASGGNGGAGGSVEGGGVFVNNGTSTFINDTIVDNIATLTLAAFTGGAGGASGDAAGSGSGTSGTAGNPGTGAGGGYFAATGGIDNVGNTIIDLNSAGSNLSGSSVTNDPDVSGAFTDEGNNILGPSTNWSCSHHGLPYQHPGPRRQRRSNRRRRE